MSFEETLEAVVRRVVREELGAHPAGSTVARPELLTYHQAAELVGVGVSTVKTWVRDGRLPVYGVASSRRVKPSEVLAVFKRVGAPAEEKPEDVRGILATLPLRRAR